jgi:hypothetical protein
MRVSGSDQKAALERRDSDQLIHTHTLTNVGGVSEAVEAGSWFQSPSPFSMSFKKIENITAVQWKAFIDIC